MAGGNDERVNLLISAAVDGLKNVEGLISDLQKLEKSGRVELPDNSAGLREGLGKTSEEMQGLAARLTELRDQQSLVTQFAALKRETKELAEQQKATKTRATELGKALSQTEKPTRAQAQEFERAKKAAEGVDQAWISNNQQLNDLRGSLDGAGISTKDLAGEQVRINKEISGVNKQASAMADELQKVKGSASEVGKGTEKAADSVEDLGDEADKSAGLLSKLGGRLKTVGKGAPGLLAATSAGLSKVKNGLFGTDKAARGLGVSLKSVARNLVAMAAAYLSVKGLTGFFTGAVKSAASFEEQMAKVQAVTQASAQDMERLEEAATEMGRVTSFTAVQAGEALETLSRAGLNATEALKALPEVLALARGNSIDLGQAAGLITQSIQGMGGSFEESAKYADVLTRAAQRANTDVTGLGRALSYAAPTARALGLDVEKTAALVGKLADAGIDASRAGTALNSIFSQFQNPASKFRKELDAIGITTDDFGKALKQLEESGGKGQKAITAIGQEAGPALRALLAQGTGSLRELEAELRNSGGAAQEAADTMDDTLPGAMERLSSAWDTLKRTIGENVLEPAKEAIDDLAESIGKLISDGKITQIGVAFSEAFKDMVAATRDFLENFNVDEALERTSSALSGLGTIARNTGNALTIVIQSVNAVWQGVNFIVGGIMATMTKGVAVLGLAVNLVVQGLNKIGVISDETARKFDTHAGAINAMADAMANHSVDSLKRAGQAIVDTGQAMGALTTTTNKSTEAAKKNAVAVKQMTAEQNFWAWAAKNTAIETENVTDKVEEQTDRLAELRENYRRLRDSGTATAQELGNALRELSEEQRKAADTALTLSQAHERLGTSSQAQLIKSANLAKEAFETIRKSGTASAFDVANAYKAYAEAAIKSGDDATIAAVQVAGAMAGLTGETEGATEAVKELGAEAATTKQKMDELKASGVEAGDALEGAGKRGATMGDIFGAVISSARMAVADLSVAARKLFNQKTGLGDIDLEAKSAAESLREVESELGAVNNRLILTASGDWLNRWIRETKVAGLEVQKAFYAQAVAMENLQEKVESGTYSMEQLNSISESAANKFNLLDDQRLSDLASAIDNARNKMDSLNASAESTLNSLQQRLSDISGDTEEAQRLQYEAERKRLVELQKQAQQEGANNAAADYAKALDQLQKINAIEQKNRAEAENEREKQAADRQARQEQAERERQQAERQRNTTTNQQQSQPSRAGRTIILQTPTGGQTQIQTEDPDGLLRILEEAGLRSAR